MGNSAKGKAPKKEISIKAIESFKTKNKERRQNQFIRQKKARDALQRDERFRRKREEERNPALKAQRLAANIPQTIDRKRVWDSIDQDEADGVNGTSLLGKAVDLERLDQMVRSKSVLELKSKESQAEDGDGDAAMDDADDDDLDSMLATSDEEDEAEESDDEAGSDVEEEIDGDDAEDKSDGEEEEDDSEHDDDDDDDDESTAEPPRTARQSSPTAASSVSAKLNLVPQALISKFPSLFEPVETPKILITTGLNGTVHEEAKTLTSLFPNSNYIRRSSHRYGHKYSIREIAKFASNREYSTLIVVNEDMKRISGLTVVHLPAGPTFHFSVSNWIEGKRLRGHGKADDFYPELLLNNFRTPLGLLTAHLFRTMFPIQGEHEGRQVVTLHNQRDYIFVRHHRYIFREKRATEKSIVGTDGKVVQGVEDIRTGLQELGPRFTIKLRRVDKGIQKASGEEWKWKAESEKVRTRFQL